MKNNIRLYDSKKELKEIEKVSKYVMCKFEDDIILKKTELIGTFVEIQCKTCKKWVKVKFYNGLLKKYYVCFSDRMKGENNPFYGKKHTDESKKLIGGSVVDYSGDKNPFYGKKHTEDSIKMIKKSLEGKMDGNKNPFYGKKHTEETKKKISASSKTYQFSLSYKEKEELSDKYSKIQKRLLEEDPEKYRELRRKACFLSHESQFKNCKMNKIEEIVYKECVRQNIEMEYSVIFCKRQYDFGNKEHKILLEVHGDYWHGNPNLYGDNKIPLNETQNNKIKADEEKKKIAECHGFSIFYIWETDINNNNFSIINKIKEIINDRAS